MPTPAPSVLTPEAEVLIARFEAAWLAGTRPDPSAALAECPEADRAAVLRELLHADLEFRLKAGESARVEQYLTRYPHLAADPTQVAALVAAEFELRMRRGDPPGPTELADRFPALDLPTLSAGLDQTSRVSESRNPAAPLPNESTSAAKEAGAAGEPIDPVVPDGLGELGGYRLVRVLGAGGMGMVYEAADAQLGRRLALKVMRPELACRSEARSRFVREARTMAAIEHENVVQILYIGTADGAPFLVMPLLKGETLASRLQRDGKLPVAEAVRIGREVAAGLAACHAAGVTHRDVKPANLWLEATSGRVKILDFGLVRGADAEERMTHHGSVMGTPGYMPPEQADGKDVGPAADLFALGSVLYECLTGRKAFPGTGLTAVLRATAEHDPSPPAQLDSAVPSAISDLVVRLLAKDQAGRPASARAVAAELTGADSGGAAPIPVAPGSTDGGRRSRRALILVVAAVCVLGAAMGLLTHGEKPTERAASPPAEPTPFRGDGPPDGTPPNPAPKPPQYTGSVDLLVYRRDENGSDILVPLNDARAMPLRPNDQADLIAEVTPPAFVYVFWIDETGTVHPAYPWRFNEWESRPANEEPVSKRGIKYPGGESIKIEGPNAGTETVLMLARPTKLAATDAEIKAWFARLKPVPFRGERAHVWFENFAVLRTDGKRAPAMADLGANDGPVGLQATLRRQIGDAAVYSRAVSFSRLGTGGDK